ncbi:hypothetical protein [Azorhizobium caulinodans]|nr:hypothetical protein [Azorhizobium caulinodans]
MKKVIITVAVIAVLGVGGYFGFDRFVQMRARNDVETVFASLRQKGAQASYKDVAFTLSGRRLTVTGIEITGPAAGQQVKLERLDAQEVTSPSGGTVQAKSVELTGLSVAVTDPLAAQTKVTYSAPQVSLVGYSGPDRMPAVPPGSKATQALRDGLVLFGAVRIDSVSIPKLSGDVTPPPAQGDKPAAAPSSFTYEALTASGIGEGRIAELKVGKMLVSTTTVIEATTVPVVVDVADLRASGIDTGPIRMLTDAEPKASSPLPIYEKISTGAYRLRHKETNLFSAGSLSAQRVAINPEKLSIERLQQLSALAQQPPSDDPKQVVAIVERTLPVIDGFAVGQISVNDIALAEKDAAVKIAAMNMKGFVDGRLETLEVLGLTSQLPGEKPSTVKRAAILGLSLKSILEQSAAMASKDDKNELIALNASAAVLKSFSGFELEGLEAPYDANGKMVSIEKMSLSWGDFTGLLPTRVAFRLDKVSGPISAEDGEPFSYLAAAGMDRTSISSVLNLSYDANARSLALAPASLELEKAFSAKIEARLENVPKDVFDAAPQDVMNNPTAILAKLQNVTAGALSVTVTDLGLANLMLKQQAELAGVEPEDLRSELISGIQMGTQDAATVNPDAAAVGEAIAAFVKAPGTITVTLTPKRPLPVASLLSLDDPFDALAAFKMTATAGPRP